MGTTEIYLQAIVCLLQTSLAPYSALSREEGVTLSIMQHQLSSQLIADLTVTSAVQSNCNTKTCCKFSKFFGVVPFSQKLGGKKMLFINTVCNLKFLVDLAREL